jgi:hypothetical protein
MLTAARGGQRGKMVQLLAADPGRVQLEYSYTRPLHFAVREGHLHIDCAVADGASLTALTVIDTVAAEEVDVPSETVNVKLSAPL